MTLEKLLAEAFDAAVYEVAVQANRHRDDEAADAAWEILNLDGEARERFIEQVASEMVKAMVRGN